MPKITRFRRLSPRRLSPITDGAYSEQTKGAIQFHAVDEVAIRFSVITLYISTSQSNPCKSL